MKRIILFILFIISVCPHAHSQIKESQIKVFYEIAIRNHIDNFKEMLNDGSSVVRIEDLYFVSKSIPDIYLPKNIGGYDIKYIDIYKKKNKRLLSNGIFVVSIQPLKLEKENAIVNLLDFTVTLKKGNYNFSNGGGSTTNFKYSCTKQNWISLNTEFFGI